MTEQDFLLKLLYRSSIRVERTLAQLLDQRQEQIQLLKLTRDLKDKTDALQRAMDNISQ